MTFSASSLRPTSSPSYSQLLCSLRYNTKLRGRIGFAVTQGRKDRWLRNGVNVRSVLSDNRPSFNSYGAPESARLLERLFEQTHKLEDRMAGDEPYLRDFESDLLSALMELKEKEDHLKEVERTVLLENGKLKHAKEELERQESEIEAARKKYERLEEEMKEAKASLVSQTGQIEELKIRLRDRDDEIGGLHDAFSLKEEEMEILAVQKALTMKDEELKMTIARLEAKEEELRGARDKVTEDANDHKRLHTLAQARIDEKNMDDLAIEKLQLEAAQHEVKAATSALQKLAEMSQQLLNKSKTIQSVEADSYISAMKNNNDIKLDLITNINCIDCLAVVKAGVARLSALTDQLVTDAGLVAAS
ncbi:hypothetical protein KIW84_060780 [Lathyrus oleraceus]|uniref:Uncharacterized protein n=1 Tax=Pisum sativum TaxID=3888 RepID=A0A9D4W135_PEA|nr:hypothetical protein KIW84_060780 [Pisum sativum]